ncbi:hypothetical protein Tco_0478052 [Tanacetum coccineum]
MIPSCRTHTDQCLHHSDCFLTTSVHTNILILHKPNLLQGNSPKRFGKKSKRKYNCSILTVSLLMKQVAVHREKKDTGGIKASIGGNEESKKLRDYLKHSLQNLCDRRKATIRDGEKFAAELPLILHSLELLVLAQEPTYSDQSAYCHEKLRPDTKSFVSVDFMGIGLIIAAKHDGALRRIMWMRAFQEYQHEAGEMHAVPPPITELNMPSAIPFPKLRNNRTKDIPPAVDIQTLPESDVEDPNSTTGSPSFSCSENVKSPRIICNKSGVNNRKVCKNNFVRVKKCFVCGSKLHLIKDCDFYNCVDSVPCKSKAASVPAGSRNSSASVPADRSDPAASRNRPAVNPADRPHPAGWSKRPATVSAGRPVSAGWLNPAARTIFHTNILGGPREMVDLVNPHMGDPSTDNDIGIVDSGCSRSRQKQGKLMFVQIKGGIVKFGGGDGRISGKGTIRTSKLDFENVYYVEELQHFNLFSVSQIVIKEQSSLPQTLLFGAFRKLTNCLMQVKAYRVYNLPNKRVEETLNLRFLEDKPNVQGIGHEWSFIQQWSSYYGTQCRLCRRAAKLQRQEHEAKDAAARYGYLFSQATAEILCQAEAEIRDQGDSAVKDPAGVILLLSILLGVDSSAVKDPGCVDSCLVKDPAWA